MTYNLRNTAVQVNLWEKMEVILTILVNYSWSVYEVHLGLQTNTNETKFMIIYMWRSHENIWEYTRVVFFMWEIIPFIKK